MMMRTKLITATAALALATLGGCDRASPAPEAEASNTATASDNVIATDIPATANLAELAPPPARTGDAPAEASDGPLRAAPPAPDAQTVDDADATGMTSRVHRGDAVTNTTAP